MGRRVFDLSSGRVPRGSRWRVAPRRVPILTSTKVYNESVCKSSNKDHNSFVRYRVLTRGQSDTEWDTAATTRLGPGHITGQITTQPNNERGNYNCIRFCVYLLQHAPPIYAYRMTRKQGKDFSKDLRRIEEVFFFFIFIICCKNSRTVETENIEYNIFPGKLYALTKW